MVSIVAKKRSAGSDGPRFSTLTVVRRSYVSADIEFGPGHDNRLVNRAIQIKIDLELDIQVVEHSNKHAGTDVVDQQYA